MNFLRKTICFTKFPTFMNLFGHWAKNVPNFVLLCSAGPSKKQPICQEVFCDEKQNVSNVSIKGVFFIIVYGLRSKRFALSKKNNCLGPKNSTLCVQRKVLGENFCIKCSVFVKSYRALKENISDFWGSCFRQGCHHSVLLLPRKVSGKNFSEKKSFFFVSRLGAKNRLWKEHQDEYQNFILRVRWMFFRNNILLKLFDISLLVFWAKKL